MEIRSTDSAGLVWLDSFHRLRHGNFSFLEVLNDEGPLLYFVSVVLVHEYEEAPYRRGIYYKSHVVFN
jgi:hypothetical protein